VLNRRKQGALVASAMALGLLGAAPLAQAAVGVPGKHPDKHPEIIAILGVAKHPDKHPDVKSVGRKYAVLTMRKAGGTGPE
jgi:hypothetical protein